MKVMDFYKLITTNGSCHKVCHGWGKLLLQSTIIVAISTGREVSRYLCTCNMRHSVKTPDIKLLLLMLHMWTKCKFPHRLWAPHYLHRRVKHQRGSLQTQMSNVYSMYRWIICNEQVDQPVVRFHSISCVLEMYQHGLNIQHSFYVELPSAFLKRQKVGMIAPAAVQACTIYACPVTLSSSSNIQTSVQFKLAGHGPVTYFPHYMLSNIRDEAVCVIS